MKKVFFFLLSFILLTASFGCSSEKKSFLVKDASEYSDSDGTCSVVLCVDSRDILDRGFNQVIYNSLNDYCNKNDILFSYVKCSESREDAISCIETAVSGGADVVFLAGSAYAEAIMNTAPKYSQVCFVAIDISKDDYLSAAVGNSYSYNPDFYSLSDYGDFSNVYTITFQEEIAGYLAGYSAVSLGYTRLGFVGSVDIPPIRRYGYGFIQGANDAALDEGTEAELLYHYAGTGDGSEALRERMDKWFEDDTEIVFTVGGTIYTSVGESAQAHVKKLIGADVDQSYILDVLYGKDITVSSAMKGLTPAIINALDAIKNDNWDEITGKLDHLGLISASNLTSNYVQLPLDTTQFSESFSETDYSELVQRILSGVISVSDDISLSPDFFANNVDLIIN